MWKLSDSWVDGAAFMTLFSHVVLVSSHVVSVSRFIVGSAVTLSLGVKMGIDLRYPAPALSLGGS